VLAFTAYLGYLYPPLRQLGYLTITVNAAIASEQVTLLLQQTQVFHGTVRDNVTFGRPGATEAEIVAVATAADANDFISALPHGYHTMWDGARPTNCPAVSGSDWPSPGRSSAIRPSLCSTNPPPGWTHCPSNG
jgi:hypothetical protein